MSALRSPAIVDVDARQVKGGNVVACPNPAMALWSGHPLVYLAMTEHTEADGSHAWGAQCPYCGTVYRVRGDLGHGHAHS